MTHQELPRESGSAASHRYHEIDGCWDLDALESALRAVVAAHGIARTVSAVEGNRVTAPAAQARLERRDLRGAAPAEQQAALARLRDQLSHPLPPLGQAPAVTADVSVLADDRMRLHVGCNGLAMDEVSGNLFFRAWWQAYSGGALDRPDFSFAGYVSAMTAKRAGEPGRRSREYWLSRADHLSSPPALPLAVGPSAITGRGFTQHIARLPLQSWRAVRDLAAAARVTPATALLAGYAEVLARWGAGPRYTLTTISCDREPIHPGIGGVIGDFSQLFPTEISIDRRLGFADRARALQAQRDRDAEYRYFSGLPGTSPLFTFSAALGGSCDSGRPAIGLFGREVYLASQLPGAWLSLSCAERDDGLLVRAAAVRGLFPEGLVAAIMDGYRQMLDALAGGSAWTAVTFDLMPADQRSRRQKANDTSCEAPGGLAHEAFLGQVAVRPAAPAILTTAGSLTYLELAERAAAVAAWLRDFGVERDELVGLITKRGPEQIIGIVGISMAGAAYLPVDAALPEGRISYLLRDGQVRCVLTNTGWRPGEAGSLATLDLDAAGPYPAGQAALSRAQRSAALPPGDGQDGLVYVLYTSGTTGTPKGVMVTHRSVVNVVTDCNKRFGVGPDDRFVAISSTSFDLSVYDIFGALSAGAAVVVLDPDDAFDPHHWLSLCERFAVTIWNSVPAIAGVMAEQARRSGSRPLAGLRLVMLSGDRIPPELPAALRRLRPGLAVVSLGGPTETTVWNVVHEISEQDGAGGRSIPYGRPNTNNRAYILDSDGLDTPDWVTGEICAAGAGLARGYWRDEERTAERFWHDPRRGERLYRTGDLGRYLPDGTIEITGRRDFQIKVNGYRVEAGEVESRLTRISEIDQAAVVRRRTNRGDWLVAHLVPAGQGRPDLGQIRQELSDFLPDFMMPSAVVWHDRLPLTPNGKVDRRRLTEMSEP
ncbi:MAG TPA: amino acid adenylation domain-containing protein [Streptosporangiaceae bacterium]|nr:amino acid adenylation domain-containing protein [Streptosporangiaceae bacterium]